MSRLDALLQRDRNSLDFIRFAAAMAVIFSHAYAYTLGAARQGEDPVKALTAGNYTAGQGAVIIFFMLSGFLVTASMDRSQNALTYLKARLLRIYPGLIVVVLVTIFILGPLVTTLSLSEYFQNPQTYRYLKVLQLYGVLNYSLPGVFEQNPYPSLLNGSIWTLYWEVLCYGIVLVLWCARLLRKEAVLILGLGLIVTRIFTLEILPHLDVTNPTIQSIDQVLSSPDKRTFLYLAAPFASGMIFYFYRDRIPMRRSFALIAVLLLVVSLFFNGGSGLTTFWAPTCGAYLLFYLASSPRSPFIGFGRYGDFSYGLYIYSPLIHQSLVYLADGIMLPMVNFVLTAGITLVIAAISYHLIEKPALRLKNISLKLPPKLNSLKPVQN